MQTLNLRTKKIQQEANLTVLWNKRLSLCQARKLNEDQVATENKLIIKTFQDLLEPVAKRIQMPISVEICETFTKLHVDFTYFTRTSFMKPRITMNFPSVYELFLNKKNITLHMKKMEAQIRLIKKAIGSTELYDTTKKNKLLVARPGTVVVKFSTRTRYF